MTTNDIDKKQLNILQKMFKIGTKTNAKKDTEKIFPLNVRTEKDKKGKTISVTEIGKEKFPPIVQSYYEYFMSSTHDNAESWENRQDLWKDMELLYYNCSYISRAIEIISNEVVQSDINMQPIFVEAPKKQRDFILQFFENTGIYSLIKPAAREIVWFGNHGWILSLNKNGVEEIIPVEAFDIDDRMEFTPYEVKKKIEKDENFKKYYKLDRVKQLVDSILNKDNIATMFKSYLLGFVVGNHAIPPWRFIHFRNYTTKSPFKPFGVPMYIHAIAPYRMLDAAMTFQNMLRASNFPIDKYTIKLPNIVDPAEKLNKINQFIEQIDNLGAGIKRKENDSFGNRIFTIEDLFDFDQISRNIDLGKIDDIEMLREFLIVASNLPRNIIDPNDSSFGDSGVSLIQKFKELARTVFTIQSAVMEGVSQVVKTHMLLSGQFKVDEIDFVLSMPYPEQQTNDELVRNQQDLITLANDIIETLSDRLLNREPLPDDIIIDIYNKILPYDQKTIDNWTNKILKFKRKNKNDEEEQEESNRLEERWAKLEENYGKNRLDEIINEIMYEKRQKNLKEGLIGDRHYYSSKIKSKDWDITKLHKYDKKRMSKLKENKDEDEYYKEEVKYYSFEKSKEKDKK